MYRWLNLWLPEKLAIVACGLWYALLIFLLFAYSWTPHTGFRYLQI